MNFNDINVEIYAMAGYAYPLIEASICNKKFESIN